MWQTPGPEGWTGHQYTIFVDSTVAIDRIRTDAIGPGQRFAVAIMEVCSCILRRDNGITVRWILAYHGVTDNDEYAKVATEGSLDSEVPDEYRWETSLSQMSRMATEARCRATTQWISSHVRSEQRYMPLRGEASDDSSSTAQGSRWRGATTSSYRGTQRLGRTSRKRSTRSTKTSANGTRAPSGSPTTTSLRGVGHGRHRPGERGRTQGRRAGGGTRGPPRSSGYGMRRQRGRSWTPFGIQGSVVWSR